MRVILDIAGVILLLQGFGPLVQRSLGQDVGDSAYVINLAPELAPWSAIAVGLLGIAALGLSRRLGSISRSERESVSSIG